MNKIIKISISGIRGVKDSLELPLDGKPLLVYGENGSGKSSISDSLEWFYMDNIEHLSGQEIGKESIRNIFLPDDENSFVEILFSNKKLDTKKSLSSSFRKANSNNSSVFDEYIDTSQSENLILRYRDLVQFITATKGEKLTHLQSIIGFSEVRDIRAILKKFAGKYAREIKAANFSYKKSQQQSILMECFAQNITSEKQFCESASKLIKPLKLDKTINSFRDCSVILKSIESKEETTIVEQINFNNRVSDILSEFIAELTHIHTCYQNYFTVYSSLRKDKEKIKKLLLLDLLVEGIKALKNDIIKGDICPLCQQQKNKIELIKELNNRIEDLKEVQSEKNNFDDKVDELKNILERNLNSINGLLREKNLKDKANAAILKTIETLSKSLKQISDELKKDLFSDAPIKKLSEVQIEKKAIEELIKLSKNKAKELTDSMSGNLKLQVHTKLSRANDAYISFQKLVKEEVLLTSQQNTFEALYSDFIKRQEEALNVFLKLFSGDINKYYSLMNPDEHVGDIRLVPMKDKYDDLDGITITYNFYKTKQSPPTALLSESHINCLGLSFFLASVKAFNKENNFFLLDDVISSFDGNHRTRFMRLLIEVFSDYQIILLTHEKDFFDIASSEAKRKNWVIKSLSWTAEKGVGFETPLIDLRSRIEEKLKTKNTDGLGNDIRKYGERQLKQIALNIEADLPFRFNDRNEDRMMNELLCGIQSKINKHSPSDLKLKSNCDSLLASPMMIGNKSSHDSSFKENIADLGVFDEDVIKLIKTFYCSESKCKSFISIKNYDTVKKQIRCNCGKLCYSWIK